MTVLAAIFDAFGTLIKISGGTHPYRKLLKLGIEQGRRPQASDAENLLSFPMDLRQAADFFGIDVNPGIMNQLEANLQTELNTMQAFPDGIAVVEALQSVGIKVIVCSNLALPYSSAIERLYPTLDGHAYSFSVGAIKPSPKIYSCAIQLASALPNEAWMIGDSKRCDCDAPTKYGIRGFYLDREGYEGYRTLYQFAEELLSKR